MHPVKVIEQCNRDGRPAHICGPMVRYSKLPFRQLVRNYDVDIVYTPMMLAREFCRNNHARLAEFSTDRHDTPLVLQFGASNELDLVRATLLVQPYVDGISLNCGCPIRDQVREGIGAALMGHPERVASMVRAVRAACSPELCIEVKIRIHSDLDQTVRFAQLVEEAGADIISVHGRLQAQRSTTAPNFDAIRLVKQSVNCPVVANGDAFSADDVARIAQYTGANGVMAVRGMLQNPAMFTGLATTPWGAVERFWDRATAQGLPFRLVQHHFSEMLDAVLTKRQKLGVNECDSLLQMLVWFDKNFELKRPHEPGFGLGIAVPWKQDSLLKDDHLQDN